MSADDNIQKTKKKSKYAKRQKVKQKEKSDVLFTMMIKNDIRQSGDEYKRWF